MILVFLILTSAKLSLAQSAVRPRIVDASKFVLKASTGHNAFRFMIPKQRLREDELLSSAYKEDGNFILSWFGGGQRNILAYPVDFGKQINVVCTHPEHLSDQETTGDEGTAIGEHTMAPYAFSLMQP